jgi:hypothetical protein
MTAPKRICWLHPDDEPEFWGTDYVGISSEDGAVIPACRPCADRLSEPDRIREASDITVPPC